MALSNAQTTIASDDTRFRVVVAGRRFGKTFLAIRELARFARHPNRRVCYIAPSYRQGKQTIWQDLKSKLTAHRWISKINESELTIKLVNGSEIMIRSADNPDSLRGLGLHFVVFDEFADIKPETWTEVIRPALSDTVGHGLFIGTPKGFGNWAKDLYDQGLDPELIEWSSHQYSTLDGGRVTDEEIQSARRDLDERTFRQEYEASFETYAGAVYYSFDRKKCTFNEQIRLDEGEPLLIGTDFNVSPMSAVIGVLRDRKLHIIDAIEIYGSNTQELCDEISQKYPDHPVKAFPDASGSRRNTHGDSDHNILRQNGWRVYTPRMNPPVKDRIASVNSALLSSTNENKLKISARAKRLIECLEKQTYKGDTRQPDKNSGYDHLLDALGYLVHHHFPVQRPQVVDNTAVFGHF